MNIKLNTVVLVILTLIINIKLHSAPAYPGLIEFTQPNGVKVKIYMRGDEHLKWAESEDGFTLLYNSTGFLEYAILNTKSELIPSGIIATNINNRSREAKKLLQFNPKRLFFNQEQLSIYNQLRDIYYQENKSIQAFPTTGNRKLICILIGYTDKPFIKTQAEFNNLFNQIGYSANGATGSVKDYYLENSYGQFNLTVDVAGPYVASQNMAYYGANDANGDDVRPRELVAEAINLADPHVNFAQYDNDNDGKVDGVYIIYAGFGEEAGGGANTIWAHAWSLSSPVIKDGVSIQRYSCSAELRGSSGTNMTHIGVICHEFGHVLGAPDYYDTNGSTGGSFSGTGQWDMMAGGSWNNSGATPAHHNGFTKVVYYNWATVNVLNSSASVVLHNAVDSTNSFYRINTSTTNEYFFIENREKHKFDANIPGSGMIIYKVHSGVFSVGNQINATHPQRMFPVAQNATIEPTSTPSSYGTINTASCAWTGAGTSKNTFTDNTLPSMKSWAGTNTNKPITNISRNAINKTVSFDFMGGNPYAPTNLTAIAVSPSQINLNWLQNLSNDNVLIAFSTSPTIGNPTNGTVYSAGNSIPGGGTVLYNGSATSFNHINLNPNTQYYYKAWSVLTANSYSTDINTDATTPCGLVSSFPFIENFNDSTNLPDCWSIIDNQANGQVWQFGTHASGLTGSTGNYAFLNSDEYGSGNSQNADLITPTLNFTDFEDVNLNFKHYFRYYSGSSAKLSYSTDNGQTWTLIQEWAVSTANPATFNQTISALNNQSQVKFKWNYTGSYGWYWDIDDITISASQVINDLIVSNLTIISSNSTYNNLTITPSGQLTINNGVTLNVNGNFIIESNSSGTGTLIQSGNAVLNVSGTTSVQQYLTGSGAPAAPNGRMWYLSSPVSGATSAVFDAFSISNKLWSYSEPTFAYTEITNNTTPLIVGDAYVARMGANGNVSFTGGVINNGLYSKSLSRTGTTNEKRGYHLVGNPYPSYVDWNSATKTNLNTSIWYRTSNPINEIMVFDTYNATSGIGTSNNGVAVSRHLPPMQGFWVKVEGDFNTGTLAFNNNMRSHQSNNTIKTNNGNNIVRLNLSNGINSDQTIVNFNILAGYGFNEWDSEKMFNNNVLIPELYTKEAGINLVINSLPEITNGLIVPLFMNIGTAGQHTITADLTDFDATTDIYLQDSLTAITHDLRTGPYTFNSATVSSENRFNLLFTIITGNNNILPSAVTVYSFDQVLYVNTPTEGIIEIYDVLGKQVVKKESVAGMNEIRVWAQGIYVVRVVNQKSSTIHKVFIK